jgi:hypothetical protein
VTDENKFGNQILIQRCVSNVLVKIYEQRNTCEGKPRFNDHTLAHMCWLVGCNHVKKQ